MLAYCFLTANYHKKILPVSDLVPQSGCVIVSAVQWNKWHHPCIQYTLHFCCTAHSLPALLAPASCNRCKSYVLYPIFPPLVLLPDSLAALCGLQHIHCCRQSNPIRFMPFSKQSSYQFMTSGFMVIICLKNLLIP